MRRCQPKACYNLPRSINDWHLEGSWSKCTAGGSHFFTIACQDDEQGFNTILDMCNGRFRKLDLGLTDSHDVSQWLVEGDLLTCNQEHCHLTLVSEDKIVTLWLSGAVDVLHRPVLAAAMLPALLWRQSEDDERMHTLSMGDQSIAKLPAATSSNSKLKLREMSWSPDKSHVALTSIHHSQVYCRMDWDDHVVSIRKID